MMEWYYAACDLRRAWAILDQLVCDIERAQARGDSSGNETLEKAKAARDLICDCRTDALALENEQTGREEAEVRNV